MAPPYTPNGDSSGSSGANSPTLYAQLEEAEKEDSPPPRVASVTRKGRGRGRGRGRGSAAAAGATSSTPRRRPVEHPCSQCSAVFLCRSSLLQHEKTIHQGSSPTVRMCASCGLVFTTVSAFSQHMLKHSILEHKCSECGRNFRSQTSLKMHMTKAHRKPGAMVTGQTL